MKRWGGKTQPLYPKSGDDIPVSDNTKAMLKQSDEFVGVFHGLKTLEYDLALYESNRTAMLKTLKLLHPKIGVEVETSVIAETDDAAKAKALFSGMFERVVAMYRKALWASVGPGAVGCERCMRCAALHPEGHRTRLRS